MARKIFINLPIQDLKRAVDFFTGLGFSFNPLFTDENATCMIVSEEAFVMLLVESHFKTFVTKPISDAGAQTEVIVAISAESRAEVDALSDKALATGGKPAKEAMDHGFMYVRSFFDPDGHHWEVAWMDPSAFQKQP
jgi:predicted lactoylglutathione lyase